MNIETKEARALSIVRIAIIVTGALALAPTLIALILVLLVKLHLPTSWLASGINHLLWPMMILLALNLLLPSMIFCWGMMGLDDLVTKLMFVGRMLVTIAPAPIALLAFILIPVPTGLVWLTPGFLGLALLAYGAWLTRRTSK